EVDEVQASLVLSQANHERALDLLRRGAGTTKARDEALAKLRADEAALALARARLDKTVITAPFEGMIGLRRVSVGDFVNIGRSEVDGVQASLVRSQPNHERALDLLRRGAGTTKARDEALAKLRADEAALALARARLDKTVITAPFEGMIGLRRVSVGDFVNIG